MLPLIIQNNATQCVIASLWPVRRCRPLASVLHAAKILCLEDENVLDRPIRQYISVEHLKTTINNVQYRATPGIDVDSTKKRPDTATPEAKAGGKEVLASIVSSDSMADASGFLLGV